MGVSARRILRTFGSLGPVLSSGTASGRSTLTPRDFFPHGLTDRTTGGSSGYPVYHKPGSRPTFALEIASKAQCLRTISLAENCLSLEPPLQLPIWRS